MRRATIAYAIYMLLGGLGVTALAIYVQVWQGILIGIVVMLFAALFYFAEKRSQTGRRKN